MEVTFLTNQDEERIVADKLLFTEQSLTEEQQLQVRTNIGAIGAGELPSALPNPHKLTFTGAVNAEYDGSTPVEVEIPAGGGGGELELIHEVTLTEEIKVLTFDVSGREELLIYMKTVCAEGVTTKQTVNIDGLAQRLVLSEAIWNAVGTDIVTYFYWRWDKTLNSQIGFGAKNGTSFGYCPSQKANRPKTVQIYPAENAIKFGVGTIIQIYGR